MFLAVGASVFLTINQASKLGLVNGACGKVMDIVYGDGVAAPALPEYVWIDFGEWYRGESFFPRDQERRGWVPIFPKTVEFEALQKGEYVTYSRTMLPLRLCYGWTMWKAQGQTFRCPVVLHLSKSEKEHGLTYVAFSRVKCLKHIGIMGGLTQERLCKMVKKHGKMKNRLDEEARLEKLEFETLKRWQSRK